MAQRRSNEELWKAILAGDNEALGELIENLNPVILSESKISGHISEDVAQDIREKLVRELRRLLSL